MEECWSTRAAALNSHHFLTCATLGLAFQRTSRTRPPKKNTSALRDPIVKNMFTRKFMEAAASSPTPTSLEAASARVDQAFAAAAEELPLETKTPHRPWISEATFALIQKRNACRLCGAAEEEKLLNKRIRQAGRQDRANWITSNLSGGSWGAIRQLRKRRSPKHAGVKDLQGNLTDTAARPDTLADYFEHVQWKVHFAEVCPTSTEPLGAELPIDTSTFSFRELQSAIRKMKHGKSAGPDGIPPEFWKTLGQDVDACMVLLDLCQKCWENKDIPEAWRRANVQLLFKKGDSTLPSNYRPISLLAVGYKAIASMLHHRILHGGAEQRMRPSQFGFRPGRGTADALMLARRIIDAAHQNKNGGIMVLMLDWAKAFDRLKPDCLCAALRRFGLPPPIVDMVAGIYSKRFFSIIDHAGRSTERRQHAGIAQGCPLSPYFLSPCKP